MFRLVRDKIPEMMAKNNLVCNYAKIQNDELYIGYLKDEIAQDISAILQSPKLENLEVLANVYTALAALAEVNNVSVDSVREKITEIDNVKGVFDERYIVMYPDPAPAEASE